MVPAVEIRDLRFAYGDKPILKGVSLTVAHGEMVGILGPNGSGKTTLLKVLSRVLPGEGTVNVDGKKINEYSRRELSRRIAVVPQESHVSFPYSVAEIVLMGRASLLSPFALESDRDMEVARHCMRLTGILDFADGYLHELSGGEKQRVIIARALAQQPRTLLLDEPTTFLDIKHQLQIHGLVQDLNHRQGLTVLCALHDLNLASVFFSRVVILNQGTIVCDGAPEDVLTEDNIRDVYGVEVKIQRDGQTNRPRIWTNETS